MIMRLQEAEFRDVLATELRVLGPEHPNALVTRYWVAVEMAARGDHASAEAEFRAVLELKCVCSGRIIRTRL